MQQHSATGRCRLCTHPDGIALRVDEDNCRVDVYTNGEDLSALGRNIDDLYEHFSPRRDVYRHHRKQGTATMSANLSGTGKRLQSFHIKARVGPLERGEIR